MPGLVVKVFVAQAEILDIVQAVIPPAQLNPRKIENVSALMLMEEFVLTKLKMAKESALTANKRPPKRNVPGTIAVVGIQLIIFAKKKELAKLLLN